MGRHTCGVMDESTSPYKCSDSDSYKAGDVCGGKEGEITKQRQEELKKLKQRQEQKQCEQDLSPYRQGESEQIHEEQHEHEQISHVYLKEEQEYLRQEEGLSRCHERQEESAHAQYQGLQQRRLEEQAHREHQRQLEYYQEQLGHQQRHELLRHQPGYQEDVRAIEPMTSWTSRRPSTATSAEESRIEGNHENQRRRLSEATLEGYSPLRFIAPSSLEQTTLVRVGSAVDRMSNSPDGDRPVVTSPIGGCLNAGSPETSTSLKRNHPETLEPSSRGDFEFIRQEGQHISHPVGHTKSESFPMNMSHSEQYSMRVPTHALAAADLTSSELRRSNERDFDVSSRVETGDIGHARKAIETRVETSGSIVRLAHTSPMNIRETHQDSESQSYDRSRKYIPAPIQRLPTASDPWRYLSEKDTAVPGFTTSSGRFLEERASGYRISRAPVPNIIIEHAPGMMHHSHSLTPPFSQSRQSGPRWSAAGGAWSETGTSQKVRAYSDSAMYDSDRHELGIAASPIVPGSRSCSQGMESRVFVFERPSGPHIYQESSEFDEDRKSKEGHIHEKREIVKMEEGESVFTEGRRRDLPLYKVLSAEVDIGEGNRVSSGTQIQAWNLSPVGSRHLEEGPSRSMWLRRSSDSSVSRDESLKSPVVSDQSKHLSVSDTRIMTSKDGSSEATALSESLRTSTPSTVTSPFEPGKDSSSSFSHRKVKKYLQTRWFESRQSQSPDTAEVPSAESVDKDDVFAEPSPKLMELSPSGMLSSSAVDDNLSPSSFHSAESQMLAEVSPSAYMEATRICDDTESQDLQVEFPWNIREGSREREEGMGWHHGDTRRTPESDIRQYLSRTYEESTQRLSSSTSTYHPVRTQHAVFTFPASVGSEAFTSAPSPYTKSFPAISPLVQDPRSGVPVSTPPSPLIPSPHGIRKYSSLGSSVNPLVMVSRSLTLDDPSLSFFHSPVQPKTEFQQRSSDVPSSLRYLTSPQHLSKSLQKSLSPNPVESERLHVPARRIQSLGSYYDTLVTAAIASAPPSPIVSDIPMSPPYGRQLIQRGSTGGRHLLSSPFHTRQPRLSSGYDVIVTSSSSSTTSSSRSSSSSHCYVCPVCGVPMNSYSSMTSHMAIHVPTESTQTPGGGAVGEEGGGAAAGVQGASDSGSHMHLCRVCNRSFSRSDMLSRHMRLHTGLRPYECDLCGQVFSRSDHLHTHQRTHTGEKPYHCKFCVYAAPRRDMVTRHMRVHMRESSGPRRGRRSHSASSYRAGASRGRGIEIGGESPRTLSSSSSSSSRGFSSTASSRRHLSDLSISRGGASSLDPITGRILEGRGGGRARNWSLTSSAASSDVGSELSPLPPPSSSGRGLSSSRTLSEGSEMYPSPGYAGPSPAIWSPCTDSPAEVFTPSVRHQVRHFIWPSVTLPAPTSVRDDSGMETEDSKVEELPHREEKSNRGEGFGSGSTAVSRDQGERMVCKDENNENSEGRRRAPDPSMEVKDEGGKQQS